MADKRLNVHVSQTGAEAAASGLGRIDKNLNSLIGRYLTFAGAAYAAKKALDFTVGAAIAEEKQIRSLETSVKLAGESYTELKPAIDSTIASLRRLTEFGDSETRPALTTLIQLTGDTRNALSLLPLVADIASTGLFDMASAARYVAMAQEGNVMMLGRYIPQLRAENNEVIRNGTAAQKGAEAMRILNEKFGGTAQANLSSTAAQWKQFTNYLSDFGQAVGSKTLPAINSLFAGLSDFARMLNTGEMGRALLRVLKEGGSYEKALAIEMEAQKKADQSASEKIKAQMAKTEVDRLRLEAAQNAMFKNIKRIMIPLDTEISREDFLSAVIPNESDWNDFESKWNQIFENQTQYNEALALSKEWHDAIANEMSSEYIAALRLNSVISGIADNMSQALIYGQDFGDAVVSSLQAIAAQVLKDMAIWAIMQLIPGGNAVTSGLNLGNYLLKSISGFANGGDFIATRPQIISVAENRPERVTITPVGQKRQGSNININIYGDGWTEETIAEKLLPKMQRVIARA